MPHISEFERDVIKQWCAEINTVIKSIDNVEQVADGLDLKNTQENCKAIKSLLNLLFSFLELLNAKDDVSQAIYAIINSDSVIADLEGVIEEWYELYLDIKNSPQQMPIFSLPDLGILREYVDDLDGCLKELLQANIQARSRLFGAIPASDNMIWVGLKVPERCGSEVTYCTQIYRASKEDNQDPDLDTVTFHLVPSDIKLTNIKAVRTKITEGLDKCEGLSAVQFVGLHKDVQQLSDDFARQLQTRLMLAKNLDPSVEAFFKF